MKTPSTTGGGPAFPTKRIALDPRSIGYSVEEGMTLRDWFAAHASEEDIKVMRELHKTPIKGSDQDDGFGPSYDVPTRQQARFLHANSMIQAREGKENV